MSIRKFLFINLKIMRTSFFEKQMIVNGAGSTCGISLGYDRCAEHENGISDLKKRLGVPTLVNPIGIEQRLTANGPNLGSLLFQEFKQTVPVDPASGKKTITVKSAVLACPPDWQIGQKIEKPKLPFNLKRYSSKKDFDFSALNTIPSYERSESDPYIEAQWARDAFEVTVFGEARCLVLKSIYEAMRAGRAALTLSGGHVFAGAGLCILNADGLTQADAELILNADKQRQHLLDVAHQSGVEQVLRAAGKTYYALAPRLTPDGELEFWLNPTDQSKNRSGWFSVDELKAWAQGAGPVLKVAAGAEAPR